MQHHDVKNTKQSSADTQKKQAKKDGKDLNQPAQKPKTGSARIEPTDEKISTPSARPSK